MSRGNGRLQRSILEHLTENESTTVETLRWIIRDSDISDDLTISSLNSCNRAIKCLVANNSVVRENRTLNSFEECIKHYPGKTLNSEIRRLRLDLLPALIEPSPNGLRSPRYNLSDNEKFHFNELREEEKAHLRSEWHIIEPKLAALLGKISDFDNRNMVFHLYAKAKSIFEFPRIEMFQSFKELLSQCKSNNILVRELATQVSKLSTLLLSSEVEGFLRFKSYIHTFVNVARHGKCSLKEETIEHLHSTRRDLLEALPGFKPEIKAGRLTALFAEKARHCKILHKLIDQTVFQKFNFIQLV